MFETLESREFFSATALCDGSVAPAPVTTDTVVEARKTEYLVVKLKEVYISAIQTTPTQS